MTRTAAVALTGAFLAVLLPSAVFDIAYGRAMQQTDVRQLVHCPLALRTLRYTAMRAAKPLNGDKVAVELQDPGHDADFLLGFSTEIAPTQIKAIFGKLRRRENLNTHKAIAYPSAFGDTSLASRAFLKT